jgi:ABC-2 type transport system ATP-binding protein
VPALRIADLVVRYGSFPVLDRLHLQAEAGQITALIGPNGAGKTTTVEVCVGLQPRYSGQVQVFGVEPCNAGPNDRAQIGVMLQSGGLYPTTKALPWLTAVRSLFTDPLPLADLVDRLQINTQTTVRRMSGGEVQRLKLASALIGRPRILFLDEPTTALDTVAKTELLNFIRSLRNDGVCIVLTTHDMDEVETVADTVTVIAHGRAVATGSVEELTGSTEGLQFRARPGLNLADLMTALPPEYRAVERGPGAYVIHGIPTPQIMSTVTNWCAGHGVMATEIRTGTQSLRDIMTQLDREISP